MLTTLPLVIAVVAILLAMHAMASVAQMHQRFGELLEDMAVREDEDGVFRREPYASAFDGSADDHR